MAHNAYKDSLKSYADLAQQYYDDVSPSGANPCQDICNAVSDEKAWVSPAADDWVEAIGNVGTSIKSAFFGQDSTADSAYTEQPDEVEDDDWRATWTEPSIVPYAYPF